jgi:hypothetical protein
VNDGSGRERAQAPPTPARPPSHDEVARYAYRLFEERGRRHGHALDDWLAAERALAGGRRAPRDDGAGGAGESARARRAEVGRVTR